ncbi:MAG: DUF4389 domain-containing protein [Candidatus Micrarchaeota archaeon]|nr:DUF4389 domain-containing protein [Candidatus Micrarchaeota archaeon]
MKTLKIDVKSDQKASRLELFVRILWLVICSIVLFFFGIIACICTILQWLYILISGKRAKSLNDVLRVYLKYRFSLEGYLLMLTDERNPIIPEN